MAVLTRKQLMDLESEELGKLINAVPSELEDEIMLLLADLHTEDSIEIPDQYLAGIIDGL